jgi:hypothetical protein
LTEEAKPITMFYFSNGKLLGIVNAISGKKTDDDCSITCAFLNEFWITFQNLMKEMDFAFSI